MALAGPATNYTLMLIAALGLRLGWTHHWLRVDESSGRADFPTSVLGVFFFLNLLLGTFNLLPVPPLDGSTGIMLFMGETRAQRYLDWLRGNSYAMVEIGRASCRERRETAVASGRERKSWQRSKGRSWLGRRER